MADALREFGVIGLGRMGGGLALQARDLGIRVVGHDVGSAHADLERAGVKLLGDLSELRTSLTPPRAVFLYIPAGPTVDAVLEQLASCLDRGDVIVDGGNSYWGDSIRRHQRLEKQGVALVDLGTSGGVDGARRGACFMVGGDPAAVERVEPLLRELAVPGGYAYAGPPGSGHFAKLVHNGIEFGMLQAIGEGMDLLERFDRTLDIPAVLESWRHGSVIRGWLIDLMHDGYTREGGLGRVPPYVEDTGEVNWLIGDALRMEVPIPVISQSVQQLMASRDERKNWARAVAMLRRGFGGHPYGASEYIAAERRHGQVGGTFRDDDDEST